MKKAVEEFNELLDEVMNKVMKENVDSGTFKYMTTEEFLAIQLCLKAVDKSKDLLIAEADQLDRIEEKLDLLLKISPLKTES